jgi:phosphoglycerol transferase MdoB-like AlkP superfamily enzyme
MKKLKKLWQIKYLKNYILLIIPLILMELIFRIIEKLPIFSYQGLRIFLGLNIIALFCSFILDYLPKIVAKIWNLLLVLILAIYGIAELGFNHFLGVYASIQINSQASAVTTYITGFIKSFKWYFYLLAIPFILLLIYYIFIDKKLDLDLPKKKVTMTKVTINIFKFLIIIFICLLYFCTLKLGFMQNKLQTTTSLALFKKPSNPSLVVGDFGYIGFGILDIKEYFFPGKEQDIIINYNPDDVELNPNPSENEEDKYHSQISIDNDIWKSIIEDEKKNSYNNLNKYFISNRTTSTNEYSKMFEGKNLIVIMVESGSNLLLNEEYYPNFAKIYNEGWSFKNYYSPRNSCSTINNELSGMTGLYSIYNTCTGNEYEDNTYFESIFNLFNNSGYITDSYHDHDEYYYDRIKIHKNMGSGKFYNVKDMNLKYTGSEWASDAEMMEYYLKELDKKEGNKPFMSWITTVTSHQYYRTSSKYYKEYGDLFDENLSSDVRVYMSRLKVVDDALGILLNGLEERGILEDTVIAIFCDHYPYAIKTDNLGEALGYDIDEDNNMDQVPFVIYNKGMEKKEFNQYSTYVNLTPTLANLFGVEYDSRIYLGSDLLSKEYESIAVFADSSWKNEVGYYSSSTNSMKYYTEKEYTDEEILAINEDIALKLKMSSAAIKNNYFSYLNKKLKSYTTSTE